MGTFNLVARILNRQLTDGPPGSQIARQRSFYENIVPNDQASQVETPDCHICKFLPSGNLVCFGNMQYEVILYSYRGPSDCIKGDVADLPFQDGMAFSRLFKLKFKRIVVHGSEVLCRDLCLAAYQEKFLIVASCTTPSHPNTPGPALPNTPLVASTTFYVVSAEDGHVFGQYVILDDFIHLSHANGVYLLEDRLCILALRSQTIHILHITSEGQLLLSQKLGSHCNDDDELALAEYENAESAWQSLHQSEGQKAAEQDRASSHASAGPGPSSQHAGTDSLSPQAQGSNNSRALIGLQRALSAPSPQGPPWLQVQETARQPRRPGTLAAALGFGAPPTVPANSEPSTPSVPGLITGIKQRFIAYIYLQTCVHKDKAEARRRFFYHFEDYSSLVMWKMLDRDNLLISMGPPEVNRDMGNTASHSYCLLVYSLVEARVVNLHDVGSRALLQLYQTHWHLFHAGCMLSPWHQYLSPPGGCRAPVSPSTPLPIDPLGSLYILTATKNSNNFVSVVRRVLTNLPASSQLLSSSPYLDLTLFQYDEKHMSAMMRPRLFHEQPLRFFAKRRPDKARFKIQAAAVESHRPGRLLLAHHFHPFLPLVLCIVQSYIDPPQLTVFLRSQ